MKEEKKQEEDEGDNEEKEEEKELAVLQACSTVPDPHSDSSVITSFRHQFLYLSI